MAFSDLPNEFQNILNHNFETFGKAIIILFIILICYLFVINFEQKKSAYKLTRLFKGIFYYSAWAVLILSPFQLFLLAPAVPFSDILSIFLVIFSIFLVLFSIFLSFNTVYYGTHFLLDFFKKDSTLNLGKKEKERIFGKGGFI